MPDIRAYYEQTRQSLEDIYNAPDPVNDVQAMSREYNIRVLEHKLTSAGYQVELTWIVGPDLSLSAVIELTKVDSPKWTYTTVYSTANRI